MALWELEPKGIAAVTWWPNPIAPSHAKKDASPPNGVTAFAFNVVFGIHPTSAFPPPASPTTFLIMADQRSRLWLMYPAKLITRPVIYELGKSFAVITNVRQASVTEEIGVVSLELDGDREEIKKAIAWLENLGIKVEPVEINTIEG